MKTNYLPRNKSRYQYKKRVLALIGIFAFTALVVTIFGGMLIRIASPIWKGENAIAVGLRNSAGYLKSKQNLIKENEDLKAELESYKDLVSAARIIEDNDQALMATFGRESQIQGIPVSVLVHPPETPYDILVIDAGDNLGVRVGDIVRTPEEFPIGVVTEVYGNTSRVELYSSSGEKTNAVLERGELAVILAGNGGGNFKLTLPRDLDIEPGDRVLSAGLDARLVGIVGDVSLKPTDSFKNVIVRSPINIQNIRYVIVAHE